MAKIKRLVKRYTKLLVTKLSHVTHPANGRLIVIFKSQNNDDSNNYQKELTVVKTDEEKRLAYYLVHEPEMIDLQDDILSKDVIEDAAHTFLKNLSQYQTNQDHRKNDKGEVIGDEADSVVVESGIVRKGDEMFPDKEGAWYVTTYFMETENGNKLFEEVKSGKKAGISLEGKAKWIEEEIEIEEDQSKKSDLESEVDKLSVDTNKFSLEDIKNWFSKALSTLIDKNIECKIEEIDMNDTDKLDELKEQIKTEVTKDMHDRMEDLEKRVSALEGSGEEDEEKSEEFEEKKAEEEKEKHDELKKEFEIMVEEKLKEIAKTLDSGQDHGQNGVVISDGINYDHHVI